MEKFDKHDVLLTWEAKRKREDDRKAAEKKKREEESIFYHNLKGDELQKIIESILKYNFVDEMWYRGYVPKTYNGCYGGPGWSTGLYILTSAIDELLGMRKRDTSDIDYICPREDYGEFIEGKVIHYLLENNHETGSRYSHTVFDFVRKDIEKSVRIHEYDGLESLKFDSTRYFRSSVESVMKLDISSDNKIRKINDLLNTKITDSIIDYQDAMEKYHNNCDGSHIRLGQIIKIPNSSIIVEKKGEEEEQEWTQVTRKIRPKKEKYNKK